MCVRVWINILLISYHLYQFLLPHHRGLAPNQPGGGKSPHLVWMEVVGGRHQSWDASAHQAFLYLQKEKMWNSKSRWIIHNYLSLSFKPGVFFINFIHYIFMHKKHSKLPFHWIILINNEMYIVSYPYHWYIEYLIWFGHSNFIGMQ